MTTRQRFGPPPNPFSDWLRRNPHLDSRKYYLSATDTDLWVHKYPPRSRHRTTHVRLIDHIMHVEVKSFGKRDMPFAQRDTLKIVDDLIRYHTGGKRMDGRRYPTRLPDRRENRPGCFRSVRFLGCHVLAMSRGRPDESEWLLWDNKEVTLEELEQLLRFERDPDNPERFLDSRRHHVLPFREAHPSLFPLNTNDEHA